MKWNVVIVEDEDEIDPYCWSCEVNSDKYGKYVWISNVDDDEYEITTSNRMDIPLKVCKSLASAKRWVSINIR